MVLRTLLCLVNVKGRVRVTSEDIKLSVPYSFIFLCSVYDHVAGMFLSVYRCLC